MLMKSQWTWIMHMIALFGVAPDTMVWNSQLWTLRCLNSSLLILNPSPLAYYWLLKSQRNQCRMVCVGSSLSLVKLH